MVGAQLSVFLTLWWLMPLRSDINPTHWQKAKEQNWHFKGDSFESDLIQEGWDNNRTWEGDSLLGRCLSWEMKNEVPKQTYSKKHQICPFSVMVRMAVWNVNLPVHCFLVLSYTPPKQMGLKWREMSSLDRLFPTSLHPCLSSRAQSSYQRGLQWTPQASSWGHWVQSAAEESTQWEMALGGLRAVLRERLWEGQSTREPGNCSILSQKHRTTNLPHPEGARNGQSAFSLPVSQWPFSAGENTAY